MTGTASQVLWQVLTDAYARLGFDVLGDEAFAAMVLARRVEPASTLATIEILNELGVRAPNRNTLSAVLKRPTVRDYRNTLAEAARAHSLRTAAGTSTLMGHRLGALRDEPGAGGSPSSRGVRMIGTGVVAWGPTLQRAALVSASRSAA